MKRRSSVVLLLAIAGHQLVSKIDSALEKSVSNENAAKPAGRAATKKGEPEKAPPNATLEALLKAGNFRYTRTSNGLLEFVASPNKTGHVVFAMEQPEFLLSSGEVVKTAGFMSRVFPLDQGLATNPPPELLRRVEQLNRGLTHGKFIIDSKNPGIVSMSSAWLATATEDTVHWELAHAFARLELARDALAAFVKPAE